MLNQVEIGDNACDLKEGSFPMDSKGANEESSLSLQSELFLTRDDDLCKDTQVSSVATIPIGPLDLISINEASGESFIERKDTSKVDNTCGTKSLENICSTPRRRSGRISKLKQNSQAKKSVRNGQRTAKKKVLIDLSSLHIKRRRRSCLCKRARASVWGAQGNFAHTLEQYVGAQINLNEHQTLEKARGSQRRKKNKNQTVKNSKRSNGKPNGCVYLKVKFRQEADPCYFKDTDRVCDNDSEKNYETGNTLPKLSEEPGDQLNESAPASLLETNFIAKDVDGNFVGKSFDDCCESTLQEDFSKLGLKVDNRGSDPGISPHSEVINLVSDIQISSKGPEDVCDLQIPSQACVSSGDRLNFHSQQKKGKKGKRKDKLNQSSHCNTEGKLSSVEVLNNELVTRRLQLEKKPSDVSCCGDESLLTTTENVSGIMSNIETPSDLTLPSSGVADLRICCTTPADGNGAKVDHFSCLDGGIGSPESGILEQSIPSTTGQILPKVKTSRKGSKSRSRISHSSRTENSLKKRGNNERQVSKHKVEEDSGCGLGFSELGTGNQTLSDFGETITTSKSPATDTSCLAIMPDQVAGKIVRNAWVLCDDCHKWRRIPATLADQIEETNCRWFCKDNLDKNFADCSIPQEKSNAEINAELEISDGSGEEDSVVPLTSGQSGQKLQAVAQQSSWTLIKTNLFLHRSRKSQTIDEIMVCHCKAPSDGGMGCRDGCLNRMLNIECVHGTCPCGDLCSNQQFQKRKYSKLKWFKCGKKGYGLQVLEDISEGQFLIEYVGEVLDMHAYEARQREYALKGHKHFYFMTLNGSEVIDACAKGNLGRFINHSCDPNCRTEKWMVNGEVCIGLFALRDIKKGEEVTFDYNYVRVFGAAAKKCVCGSTNCRGYIGGDPLNAEVVVQDDSDEEYPEPVMLRENGDIDDNFKKILTDLSSFGDIELRMRKEPQEKYNMKSPESASGHLEIPGTHSKETFRQGRTETENSCMDDKVGLADSLLDARPLEVIKDDEESVSRSEFTNVEVEISPEMHESGRQLHSHILPLEASLKLTLDDRISEAKQECSGLERMDMTSSMATFSKTLPDIVYTKRKSKSGTLVGATEHLKSNNVVRTVSSSSIKKHRLKIKDSHVKTPLEKDHNLPYESRKPLDDSSTTRFETVEEKLNELLDPDGGISKRKDASRGYLKLLLLTAASGDNGNGKAIQSNRDLSMILDVLLKTKSRTVLVDIINKNGLQMLHNIMKRFRKEFNKIPILRKLLKVLEYLAMREILTSEHINGGPPCPGVESFRDSILTLTEHIDKQVHQIARSFRDRWIPRQCRKNSYMDRDDDRLDFHRGSNHNRSSLLHSHGTDQDGRLCEAVDCMTKSRVASASADAVNHESFSVSCSSHCVRNVTRTRKRKSRWDQPAEAVKDLGVNMVGHGHEIDDDAPPGFSAPPGFPSPCNVPFVSSDASSSASCHHQDKRVVTGHPQQRFVSRISVAYGIPFRIVQQFGTPKSEPSEGWTIGPGVPFHPFPPLPTYSHDKRHPLPSTTKCGAINQSPQIAVQDCHNSALFDIQSPAVTYGINPQNLEIPNASNHLDSQRGRSSYSLGRTYFRQQKWNNTKTPPWIRMRNGWGSRNGLYNSKGLGNGGNDDKSSYSSNEVGCGAEIFGHTFHEPTPQQN